MSRVTILMPVYNAARHLARCVESVLTQTFSDFQLLVIDDASTDNTWAMLKHTTDSRLRIERNPANLGVAATLNRGIELTQTEFLARLDADDLCRPQRLALQVRHLEAHPRVGIVGTYVKEFGDMPWPVLTRYPLGAADTKAGLLFGNTLCHPVVMMRMAMIREHALRYDPVYSRAEDYDLWIRAARCFDLDNVPYVGLAKRTHKGSVTAQHRDTMRAQSAALSKGLLREIGIEAASQELALHARLGAGERLTGWEELDRAEQWLKTLASRSSSSGCYEPEAMRRAVGTVWWRACLNSTPLGPRIWKRAHRSPLAKAGIPTPLRRAIFGASIAWHTARRGRRQGAES